MLTIPAHAAAPIPHSALVEQRLAKARADKDQAAREAVSTLKALQSRRDVDRQAAARKRMDAVRERLRQLLMLGATPRQLALLAKELAAAVREYAAAGGKPAARAEEPATERAAKPEDGEAAPPARPEDPYREALSNFEADAERLERRRTERDAEIEADRQFLLLARKLAKKIKAAAALASRGADPAEAKAARDAVKDVEREIAAAERALGGTSAGRVSLKV